MDLDKQIQVLIEDAPQDGVTPRVVEAIAPTLKLLAAKLRHTEYYILQSLDEAWVATTLSDRNNPDLTKNVIYAFPTLKDATDASEAQIDPQVLAVPIPVTHILFQLFALETVDSIIFFDTLGDLNTGVEIRRADMQNLIQQVQQKSSTPSTSPKWIPPDIA